MRFNSDHHYYFILARYVLRPIFEEEVFKYLGIYGSKPSSHIVSEKKEFQQEYCKKTTIKPTSLPIIKPEPSPPSLVVSSHASISDADYKKYIEYLNNKSEKDNKHSIIISNAPKPVQISMYCVV